MYYQLYVEKRPESSSEKTISLHRFDLSEERLMSEVLYPFTHGENFRINGYTLNESNVERIRVIETRGTNAETCKNIIDSYVYDLIVSDESLPEGTYRVNDVTEALMAKGRDWVRPVPAMPRSETKKVFIVHGHDMKSVMEIEKFVRQIGFEPIVLFEQPDKGNTIIEKIEENVNEVCYGIVIYSPCDLGYPVGKEGKKRFRARQNVVFEHGYLMAKLGRRNVCALVASEDIETPSDISGILFISMKDRTWKLGVAKNMTAVGVFVDPNLI